MKTVYVLTQGEYSDYHIVALFSTRELAEEAKKHFFESEIEEYNLDASKIPEHPPGHYAWEVEVNVESNIIENSSQVDSNRYFKPIEFYSSYSGKYRVNCWARDKEHAEKIALDKFYQWKWDKVLSALYSAGVDNWEGYEDAMDALNED